MFKISSEKWAGVAKVIEEMGELGCELGRLMAVDGNAETHWKGDIRPAILDETADVLAAISFFIGKNFTDEELEYVMNRSDVKLNMFAQWMENSDG